MPMPTTPFHAFVPYPAAPGAARHQRAARRADPGGEGHLRRRGLPDGLRPADQARACPASRPTTAPIVRRFLDAGARFVGKTHTVELAFSLNGMNSHFGTPINPAAPDRMPGGSSSGSAAAVAGRLADIGLGSDTGGSVRGPASYCGLFGIRPTHGRLSLDATMPLADSFDTPGWFARDGKTFERVADGGPRRGRGGAARAAAAAEGRRLLRPGRRRPGPGARRRRRSGSTACCRPLTRRAPRRADFDALYWAFRCIQGARGLGLARRVHRATGARRSDPGIARALRLWPGRDRRREVEGERAVRKAFRSAFRRTARDGRRAAAADRARPRAAAGSTRRRNSRPTAPSRCACSASPACPAFRRSRSRSASDDGAPFGLSLIGPPGSDLSLVRLAVKVAKAAARAGSRERANVITMVYQAFLLAFHRCMVMVGAGRPERVPEEPS